MKDLFGKIGESLANTYKEVSEQAEKAVDQTKCRADIISLKNDLKKLYQRLGEEYYKAYISEVDEMPLSPICNKITVTTKEIEKLEKAIKTVVDEQKDSFSAFKRGVRTVWKDGEDPEYPLEKDDENNDIKVMKFCDSCNVGNSVDATYCVNCGTKFE